jgi:phosphoribulokinase
MSTKHPIISVVGSSGAGTSTVKDTFEKIFLREKVSAAMIEGDAFHKFNRVEMKKELERRYSLGDQTFSHFSYDANLLEDLQNTFKNYGETGTAKTRNYVHNLHESELYDVPSGEFTEWRDLPSDTDLLFYEGLHGAAKYENINIPQYAFGANSVPFSGLRGLPLLRCPRFRPGCSSTFFMGNLDYVGFNQVSHWAPLGAPSPCEDTWAHYYQMEDHGNN